MTTQLFTDWQEKPLEEILLLCRELVEDGDYPTVGRWRESGGKVVGHFQVYFPEEIADAAGLLPVKICGAPIELKRADSHFGSYLCSILKTSLELALTNPGSQSKLAAIGGMPAATVRRSASELLAVLASAVDSGHVPPARPGEQEKILLKSMQAKVAEIATELGITAEIIAPRKELAAAALGERQSRVFSGWRRDIVGQQLLDMI